MLDNLFQGVFDSNYVNVISVDKFLLCVAVSLYGVKENASVL